MNIAHTVKPLLPYLRRYARSLTGSQSSGDHYVAVTLEALIADPHTITAENPAVSLYRLFTRVWSSVPVNLQRLPVPATNAAPLVDQRLERLTPASRQAFLLVTVEGFDREAAALILDKPVYEVNADLDRAGAEIAEQVATHVLIIEDEPLIAMDLEGIVKALGHDVLGIARTRTEAVAAIKKRRPGLILADIQLADGSSGLDAVHDIIGTLEVPVIFITAYPESVLTGLKPEPTFLIAKPFSSHVVQAVISQALFFDMTARLPNGSAATGPDAPLAMDARQNLAAHFALPTDI
jgi:DNA-directed RNA polymerase specialized sigma24 family protein